MDLESILRAYQRISPIYDITFGLSLGRGRKLAVEVTNRSVGKVLEVGVGTGMSLPAYRREQEVTGIDVSPHMLQKARARVEALRLSHVRELIQMDASDLAFPDNTFDTVVAMYVMPVVPDPKKVLSEIERVCAPGGRVIVVNHFARQNGFRGKMEKRLVPICNFLGWKLDFYLEEVLSGTSLDLLGMQSIGPFGLFTMLHFRKNGVGGVSAPDPAGNARAGCDTNRDLVPEGGKVVDPLFRRPVS